MPETPTPYAEAVALFQSGLPEAAITERLKSRGLDDEAVRLLLVAIKTRAPDSAPNSSPEWIEPVEAPKAAEPAQRAAAAEPGLDTCSRCGTFVTAETQRSVLNKLYCTTCAARPDVSYLKAFRDAHWGKRDGWAWLFGVFAVFSALVLAGSIANGGGASALPLLASASVFGGFWGGWRPARILLFALAAVNTALSLTASGAPGILGFVFLAVIAVRSPRNKLFFEIELTDEELLAAWRAVNDNRVALWARGVAVIALISCCAWIGSATFALATLGLGTLATVLGGIGLSRVDPTASPPIGQRAAALFGTVGGAVAAVAATVFLVFTRVMT